MHRIEHKVQAVFRHLTDELPEGIFLFNRDRIDKNFFYITELENGVFENCGAFVERDGKVYVFTSTLEEEAARSAEGYAEIVVYRNEQERVDMLKSVLSRYSRVGICYDALSHSFYLFLAQTFPHIHWIDSGRALKKARMIKKSEEIDKIRRACDIASQVADAVPGMLREGMTELDLSAEIDYHLKRKGAQGAAFKTIAAFAKNTSMPHYSSADVPLRNGDVVLVDFGAEYRGYASDITQTYITGRPDGKLVDLYTTVHKVQRHAIERIREGVSCEEVDREVRELVDAHDEYRGRFIHSLGHSLGLDVHDDSYPSEEFNKQFAANMVLTVEPGIYLPGLFGVRLEDDVVVTEDGCKVLTTSKKDFRTYEIR